MKNLGKKGRKLLLCALLLFAALAVWTAWGNKAVEVNEFAVSSGKLPESFSGFRIAQISDLHNAEFDEGSGKLIELLKGAEPDIIVITGDIVDSRRTDIDTALSFAAKAQNIAPCYYVTGNHEARIAEWTELESGLVGAGVTVLKNEKLYIERGGEQICVAGLSDPAFYAPESDPASGKEWISKELDRLLNGEESFTVLLSHRPEYFELYAESGADLTFSGHAHGGQIRLPFVGGLFALGQGLFPKYDAGLYFENGSYMAVSRGLGNSLFPFRFNNRPEIVLAELKTEE